MRELDCLLISYTRENFEVKSTNYLLKKYGFDYQVGLTLTGAITYLGSYLINRGYSFDYALIYDEVFSSNYQNQILIDKLKQNKYKTIAISTSVKAE